jgi:hypothetical protein
MGDDVQELSGEECEVVLEDNLTSSLVSSRAMLNYPPSGWISQSKSHELTTMSLPDDSAGTPASIRWLVLVTKMQDEGSMEHGALSECFVLLLLYLL